MTLLRVVLGETLRTHRLAQRRTLREVSAAARVSLGYLSEVERGQKEASSELLASICEALNMELPELLVFVSDEMASGGQRFTTGSDAAKRVLRQAPDAPLGSAEVADAGVGDTSVGDAGVGDARAANEESVRENSDSSDTESSS